MRNAPIILGDVILTDADIEREARWMREQDFVYWALLLELLWKLANHEKEVA